VAQKELDLVQIPSGIATKPSARPTEVMRGQILNGCSFGAVLYNMPHDAFRYALSPSLACSANASKHAALLHASGSKPRIDSALYPVRNGYRSNVAGLTDHVDDRPVILPPLEVGNIQFCRLSPAQSAPQEDGEECSISFAFERAWIWHLPERLSLIGGEPVAKTNAEVLRPSDAADTSSEIWAQQTGIGSFVGETSDRRKAAVDCAGRKMT